MTITELFSERFALLDHEPADSVAAGEVNSGYVDMGLYPRLVIVVSVGDMVATATLDIDIEQATSSGGAGAKNITGKSITQLTQAGGDSDTAVCIEVNAEELDVANGFAFVNVECTVANAAVELAWFVFGDGGPRYKSVSTAAWQEVVS